MRGQEGRRRITSVKVFSASLVEEGGVFQNEGSAQLHFCHRQAEKMRRARLTLAQEVVYVLFF